MNATCLTQKRARKPRFGPLAGRILARLRQSQVPVRTSILVAQCAAGLKSARSQVWRVLTALQAAGLVARATVPVKCLLPCCPACGRRVTKARGGATKESFWTANKEAKPTKGL